MKLIVPSRAIIPQSSIKSIDKSTKSLGCKRTQGFVKACEELRRHQELLEQSAEDGHHEGQSDEEMEQVLQEVDRLMMRGSREGLIEVDGRDVWMDVKACEELWRHQLLEQSELKGPCEVQSD